MKFLSRLLFFLLTIVVAHAQDPRALSLTQVQEVDPSREGLRRDGTAYSIVVYGADDLDGNYRIEGLNRKMKLKELRKFLTSFYTHFPKDAKTHDKRLDKPVPLPNILYRSGGWNETKQDGRKLVKQLAKEHGVALYHFTIVPEYEISFSPKSDLPSYQSACIQYYQSHIFSIDKQLGSTESNNSRAEQ